MISGRVTEFNFHTQLGSARLERLDRTGVVLDVALPAIVADTPDADRAAVNRYWERRENMRVEVPAGSIANGPRVTFTSTADGEIYVTDPGHPVAQRANPYARRAFRDPHPLDNDPALFDDQNAYRILLGSLGIKAASGDSFELIATAPTFSTLAQRVVGGVYFAFSKWSVQVDAQPQWSAGPDPAANHPPTAPNRALEQTFSDYNVENLYDYRDDPFDGCDFTGNTGCTGVSPPFDYVPASDAEYQNRLGLIARQIVEDLHAPDVVMTQEGEDQDICVVAGGQLSCGTTNNADGKPDSLQELALRIEAIGGPRYDTAYDRNGADARGIVSAFMFRTDRVELLPVTASDPVFGSSPQVVYDTTPLAYNADVQNPKALNAVLPPRAIDGTGTDGTNVYTRAPQVGSVPALARRRRDERLHRRRRDLEPLLEHAAEPRRPAARAGALQRADHRRAGRGAAAGHHRGRLQRVPAARRPVRPLEPALPDRPARAALRPRAGEPVGGRAGRGARGRVLVRVRRERADARPAVRQPGALRAC